MMIVITGVCAESHGWRNEFPAARSGLMNQEEQPFVKHPFEHDFSALLP